MTQPEIFEALGMAGSLILCGSALPQVFRTWSTRSAGDFSIFYLGALLAGLLLLEAYCLYTRDPVFLFGNSLSLLMTAVLVSLWFRFRKRPAADTLRTDVSRLEENS